MIIDKALEFADDSALSLAADTPTKSAVVADLLGAATPGSLKDCWGNALTPDIGETGNLMFCVEITTTLVGSGTFKVELTSKAADNDIHSGGTAHLTHDFGATPAAGTRWFAKVPTGTINRFVGAVYTAVGNTITAGAVSVWVGMDHERID